MIDSILYPTIFNALWQAALIGAGAWAAIRFLQIMSPHLRGVLWSAAFFAAAIAPLVAFAPTAMRSEFAATIIADPVAPVEHAYLAAAGGNEAAARGPRRVITWSQFAAPLLVLLWAAGTSFCLFAMVRDSFAIMRLRRESFSIEMPESPLVRRKLMAPANVALRVHPSLSGPVATGLFNPAILLPVSMARNLETQAAQNILAHELAHIKRGDLAANFMEALIMSIFWWNPILGIMRASIAENREMACDDHAVSGAGDAGGYATAIIECAEHAMRSRGNPVNAQMLSAADNSSVLSKRVMRLLSETYAAGIRVPLQSALAAGAVMISCMGFVLVATPPIALAIYDATPAEELTDAQKLGRKLVTAVLKEDFAEAERLVTAGADVNAVLEGEGTPLIAAVSIGSLDFVVWLIDRGADVDAYARYDETGLITAVREKRIEIVRQLIAAGADVNRSAKTENGELRSPLGEAQRLKDRAIIKLLRDSGATE